MSPFARFIKTLTPLPLHPLYLLTAALTLGIAWQAAGMPFLFPALAVLLVVVILAPQLTRPQVAQLLLAAVTIFFVGAFRMQQRIDHFNAFYRMVGRRPVEALQSQVIDCEPSYRQPGATIATLEISGPDKKIVGYRFFVNISGAPPFEVGDTVSLNRVFFRQPPEGEYTRYLVKERLVAHLRMRPEGFAVLEHPSWSFYRTVSDMRNGILESAKQRFSPVTFALFTSIFWGKHAIDQRQLEAIRDQFRPWGILHYLARAGLHLTMLIALLQKLVSFLPLPFMIRTVLGAGLIGTYALLTWSSISFIRAILVFFIFVLCTLLWTPSHSLYRLTLACFLILLLNPLQLFFLDFQLSFLVTFVFMWLPTVIKAENS